MKYHDIFIQWWTSLVVQTVKCLPTMWETRVPSLGWEDALEKEMATHSSTLAWKIPWMEEPGRLQSMGLQRVRHDWATSLTFIQWRICCCCCCSSFAKLCLTLCDSTDCSKPGFPVLHHLQKFAQVHVHCIGDVLQPSYSLMPSSALNLSQHQGLCQWVGCSHQEAKIYLY